MEKILADLEAAMNAEKKPTSALTVAKDVFVQLKARLKEHAQTSQEQTKKTEPPLSPLSPV